MSSSLFLYGGSFDPVHYGHLIPLNDVLKQYRADSVIFLPCYHQPLKSNDNTDSAHRIEMLELALSSFELVAPSQISRFEIEQKGKSYTLATVKYFQELEPNAKLYFIVGMDSLKSFHRWHQWQEILKHCDLLVMKRGGETCDESEFNPQVRAYLGKQISIVETEDLEVSSTQLRKILSQGKTELASKLMPEVVIDYALANDLYI